MPAGSGVRALRAAVFAAVCVLLGALGHVLMSGLPLPWWALAGAALGTASAAWCCAGRERTTPWVVGFTVAAQAALHTCFTLAQAVTGPSTAPPSFSLQWARYVTCGLDMRSLTPREATRIVVDAGLGDHLSAPPPGGAAAMAGMPGMAGMAGMPSGSSTSSMGMGMGTGMETGMAPMPHGMSGTGMLAAHLLAALVCGLWLAHGERAAFRLARVVAQWLRAPLHLPAPHSARVPERPGCAVPHEPAAPRPLLLTYCVITRGPPARSAVA
ncbi:hypothetical protein AB0910_10530 [Streptomyces sp. NPDC047002]|uniref:hypothetical protein n=1 Tax=Streptomyces sp. NPDC047002 TaxID=3155475 RepID=UPI003455AFD2